MAFKSAPFLTRNNLFASEAGSYVGSRPELASQFVCLSLRIWQLALELGGDCCLEVRYEDMVDSPESSILRIRNYLGVEPMSSTPQENPDSDPMYLVAPTSEAREEIFDSAVGRSSKFPRIMASTDRKSVDEVASLLGYTWWQRPWLRGSRRGVPQELSAQPGGMPLPGQGGKHGDKVW